MKYVINGMKVPGSKVPPPHERVLKVILSPEIGNVDNLTFLFSLISPGNSTGLHTHESDEVMYVAKGKGISIVGNEEEEIEEDSVIFAPKLIKHEVKNTGDGILKLICFYNPPLKPSGYFEEAINKAKEYLESL